MVYYVGGPPYPLVVLYYLHRVKKSGRIIRPDFRNFGRIIRFRPDSENPDPVHPYSHVFMKEKSFFLQPACFFHFAKSSPKCLYKKSYVLSPNSSLSCQAVFAWILRFCIPLPILYCMVISLFNASCHGNHM